MPMTDAMTTVAPATTAAVSAATSLANLADAAANDPQVQKDLGAQFDTISHSPIAQGLATLILMGATQEHITLSSSAASLLAGLGVMAVGYVWQYVSMKMHKPVATN